MSQDDLQLPHDMEQLKAIIAATGGKRKRPIPDGLTKRSRTSPACTRCPVAKSKGAVRPREA